ncbi:MAG: hypothetical protein GTO55_00300, partial [Armatimonadetes bacterium]|nr:hypothetical protein [Armatimonadota bacterium]NIM22768.1 hypothetical protein [Armatimonadota bacterium]NIM66600.1 hypothetical protein [Armatimonadota bacterium]NIN04824.1 hypothetical protein [Armatimonadota bacterium]NIO95690.1 hypothetical protein [Armatimonadota bacterium]
PRSEGEIDHENEVIYEAFQSRPWDEILEFAEHAFQSLLHQVSLLDEATLEEHLFPPPLEDRPLWREIVGTSYIHSILHLAQYYRERGDSAQVQALNEEMARSLPDLDPGPKWQGLVKYNLACHFSLSGEKSKAIPLLQEALELEPDL